MDSKNLYLGNHVSIGSGCTILQAHIGDHTQIGHDVFIGKNVRIGKHVVIEDACKIADGCSIADHATLPFASCLKKNTHHA